MIKCGVSEIDGHAFCSGFNALNLDLRSRGDLQGLIPPITYLIQGAIFRPRHGTSQSGRFSLGIRPLGELVDMYHTRLAKHRHDKVYALLGMSSDDPSVVGLSADYTTPWETVFRKLVQFSVSNQVAVDISRDQNTAVINGNGRFLGRVISMENTQSDRQRIAVEFEPQFYSRRKRASQFTVQSSAKHVREGDSVCLLQGALTPTIIRECCGVWKVIRIAFPLVDKERPLLWPDCIRRVTEFPDPPFQLVWDWAASEHESQAEFSGTKLQRQLDNAARVWDSELELAKVGGSEYADALDAEDGDGQTALLQAATAGHEAVTRSLLHNGACIEATDRDGRTPLSLAAEAGHKDVVRLLLSEGAEVEARDNDGRTPLSRAVEAGHENVVRQLIRERRAKTDAQDDSGQTPVSRAASAGNMRVLGLVLKRGAPVDVKDGQGRTPLSWAAGGGHKKMVQRLLDKKAVVDSKDRRGRTPLVWAVEAGRMTVVELLLAQGANIEEEDDDGRKPLSLAAEAGHDAVVRLLLNKGADIKAQDGHGGRTPLSWAAEAGHKGVIWILLKRGAMVGAKDKNGRTPLWHATEAGHQGVVELLRKHLA